MTSILDEKRRIVLPKEIVEELGLEEGAQVSFKKGRTGVIIQRAGSGGGDALKEAMEWNPRRQGKPVGVEERSVKEIWE